MYKLFDTILHDFTKTELALLFALDLLKDKQKSIDFSDEELITILQPEDECMILEALERLAIKGLISHE